MGTPIEVTTRIEATPEAVWAIVADLPKMGELSPENEGAVWLGGATGAVVGATFKGTNQHGKRSWSTKGRIVEATPGKSLAFVVNAGPFAVAEWRYELATDGTGCTVTESTTDRRGSLLRMLSKAATGVADRSAHNRATMTETLAALKVKAEQPPA
jgi:Polyketide cyclase / dehydrase and lipid transport